MKSSPWLLAIRPKTLTAAFVPIFLGTALSFGLVGRTQVWLSVFALLSALFIQIGTNFINDALDFKKGADTSERLGPQRVTQSGLLSPRQVWWGGIVCFLVSALLALPLVYVGGWPIVVIGVFSLLAGYVYTGGPFPLAYVGLGDLFGLIFFGWVAVAGVFFLNAGSVEAGVWVAGTQIGLLATVMIAVNNLRDAPTDRKVNKRTLAVRFGVTFGRLEIGLLCLVPFLGALYWFQSGFYYAAAFPLLVFPLAVRLTRSVWNTAPGVAYNRFLALGALLHLSFGALLSLGLLFGSGS